MAASNWTVKVGGYYVCKVEHGQPVLYWWNGNNCSGWILNLFKCREGSGATFYGSRFEAQSVADANGGVVECG